MSKDRMASLIFLLTGSYGVVFSVGLSFGTWEEPGPAVFPLGASGLLLLVGILTFIFGGSRGEEERRRQINIRQFFTPVKIVGLTGAFILFLERLGYLAGGTLFIFLLFFWVSRYRLSIAAGLALGIGVGSWYFFGRILAVPLPAGILPF